MDRKKDKRCINDNLLHNFCKEIVNDFSRRKYIQDKITQLNKFSLNEVSLSRHHIRRTVTPYGHDYVCIGQRDLFKKLIYEKKESKLVKDDELKQKSGIEPSTSRRTTDVPSIKLSKVESRLLDNKIGDSKKTQISFTGEEKTSIPLGEKASIDPSKSTKLSEPPSVDSLDISSIQSSDWDLESNVSISEDIPAKHVPDLEEAVHFSETNKRCSRTSPLYYYKQPHRSHVKYDQFKEERNIKVSLFEDDINRCLTTEKSIINLLSDFGSNYSRRDEKNKRIQPFEYLKALLITAIKPREIEQKMMPTIQKDIMIIQSIIEQIIKKKKKRGECVDEENAVLNVLSEHPLEVCLYFAWWIRAPANRGKEEEDMMEDFYKYINTPNEDYVEIMKKYAGIAGETSVCDVLNELKNSSYVSGLTPLTIRPRLKEDMGFQTAPKRKFHFN